MSRDTHLGEKLKRKPRKWLLQMLGVGGQGMPGTAQELTTARGWAWLVVTGYEHCPRSHSLFVVLLCVFICKEGCRSLIQGGWFSPRVSLSPN